MTLDALETVAFDGAPDVDGDVFYPFFINEAAYYEAEGGAGGWMTAEDENGVPYWYDQESGASQYEDPYAAPYA